MAFEYIIDYYKVPAEINREIEFDGRKGMIVEDRGNYIGVNFYDDKPDTVKSLHPTYNVTYLESFGKPRAIKNRASKQRYQDYLHNDGYGDFAEYLGIKK